MFTKFTPNPTNLYQLALFISLFIAEVVYAQSPDTLRQDLTIDLEVRPRAEYRENFMWTPADTLMPELYTTQRNRLSVTYRTNWLRLHASPQEIHVWGESGQFSQVGNVNFFEAYAEPSIFKNLSIRIGRQALSLDNGRIFSAAP